MVRRYPAVGFLFGVSKMEPNHDEIINLYTNRKWTKQELKKKYNISNNKLNKILHKNDEKWMSKNETQLKNIKEKMSLKTCKNKQLVSSLKKPCVVCGEDDPVCIDFHHRNPKDKKYAISCMYSLNEEKIRKEIEKCVCVCSNCHRKIHAGKITV